MKSSLILAVGKYDVRLDGRDLKSPFSNGRETWENFDALEGRISLPLVQPALEELNKIIKYEIDPSKKITDLSKVYILASEQAKAGLKSREKDTIWFARIIRRILESRWKIKTTKIEIIRLTDLAFPAVGAAVKKLEKNLKSEEHIFLKLEGSLPFLSMAVLSRLVLRYENRVRMIRISDDSRAFEDYNSIRELLRIMRLRNAMNLIESFQYSACIPLFREDEDESQVFRFLTAWKNMDFELAEYLQQNRLSPEFQRMFQGLFEVPRSIPDGLRELFHNMDMQLKTGEFVDVLGRLYSFRENILKYGLSRIGGYPLDMDLEEDGRAAHMAFLDRNPALLDYLRSRREGGGKLRYEEMTFRVLRWMLRYYAKTDETARRLYSLLNRLDEALEYRNQTIIGHGFRGCSRVILEDKLKMKTSKVMEYLNSILKLMNIKAGPSPFDRANRLLLERFAARS